MAEETIFGNATPSGTFEEGAALSLGTRFTISANGTSKRARFYCPPSGAGGAVIMRLWRVSDTNQLANVTFNAPVEGWNELAWTQGDQALVTGTTYEVSYATPNRYSATPGDTWPKTSAGGHITTTAPGGYFGSGSTGMPAGTFGNNNYLADTVIDFGGGTTTVSGTLDLRWAVRNTVSGSLDLRWAVANTVSGTLDLRWALRAVVSGSLDLRWAQLASVAGSIALQWAVLAPVSGTLDLRWAVRSQISGSLDLRWIVRNRVTGSLALLWVVDGVTIRLIAMASAQLTEQFSATPVLEGIVADLVER